MLRDNWHPMIGWRVRNDRAPARHDSHFLQYFHPTESLSLQSFPDQIKRPRRLTHCPNTTSTPHFSLLHPQTLTMADADEDAIPPPVASSSTDPDALGDDPTDEVADYTLLTTSLPRRGLKDFEPTTLSSQKSALTQSREAMHAALSYPRVHGGKSHVVGVYVPESHGWYGGESQGRCVRVDAFKGQYGRSMGVGDAKNRFWLNGEEALFLLESGRCDVRWPVMKRVERGEEKYVPLGAEEEEDVLQPHGELAGENEQEDVEASELPMSLQGAYASFIGKSGLTLERYIVYAGLRRSGYTVVRAPTWSEEDVGLNGHARLPPLPLELAQTLRPSSSILSNVSRLIHRLVQYLFKPDQSKACPSLGPLVAPGLYRNYNDIFRALSLIPYHDPSTIPETSQPKPPFRIAYHVYKPNTAYRKTMPPPPDFRIAVLDARTTSVPTLDQIGALLDSMPLDSLPKEKRLEQRLKHGKRNVILAVVDTGVVSYMRLSDAGFGSVKLFNEEKRKGGKGGARGKKAKTQ
jgi:tRNA-splicing endonuclease subunit Sen54